MKKKLKRETKPTFEPLAHYIMKEYKHPGIITKDFSSILLYAGQYVQDQNIDSENDNIYLIKQFIEDVICPWIEASNDQSVAELTKALEKFYHNNTLEQIQSVLRLIMLAISHYMRDAILSESWLNSLLRIISLFQKINNSFDSRFDYDHYTDNQNKAA